MKTKLIFIILMLLVSITSFCQIAPIDTAALHKVVSSIPVLGQYWPKIAITITVISTVLCIVSEVLACIPSVKANGVFHGLTLIWFQLFPKKESK